MKDQQKLAHFNLSINVFLAERIDVNEDNASVSITVSFKVVKKELVPPLIIVFVGTFYRDYCTDVYEGGWILSEFKLTQFGKLDESQILK